MDTAPNYPPTTAYEALVTFFPNHRLHTVVKTTFFPKHVEMQCSCESGKLSVTEKMVAVHNWKLNDIKHALRNVPQGK